MLSGKDDKENNAKKASHWDNVGFIYVPAVNVVVFTSQKQSFLYFTGCVCCGSFFIWKHGLPAKMQQMWPLEMADPEKGRGMLLTQVGFGQENALAEFDSGYSSKSLLVAPMPPRVLSKKNKTKPT